jgi:hypothetical protein
MKSLISVMFLGYLLVLLNVSMVNGQSCELWSEPDSLSDSQSTNNDPFLIKIREGYDDNYYVFWIRYLDLIGTEIVYLDYYNSDVPVPLLLAEGYNISNPRVIPTSGWGIPMDTLAFIFYETNQNANQDIYYIVMTADGFSTPLPFVNSPADESNLRVSADGSMVWEEGGAIKYCQLGYNNPGFYFTPAITLDEGDCHHPDLQQVTTDFIVWEKSNAGNTEIWYSAWDYANQEWGTPIMLYDDGMHSNPKFSTTMDDWGGWMPVLLTDFLDSTGQYHFSYIDLYDLWETISEFGQDYPMEPELFTVDLITDFWGSGYMAFKHDEGSGNSDIYSSDYLDVTQYFNSYCSIDSTSYYESRPALFQGKWYFDAFDLICVWESWRNGHIQLFTSTTLVTVGNITETSEDSGLQVTVYPNPFRNYLNLEMESNCTNRLDVRVYNSLGQLVEIVKNKTLSIGSNVIKINTEELGPGIYFIRLETGDKEESLKLVKK